MNELPPFTLFSNIRAERYSIKLAGSKFRSNNREYIISSVYGILCSKRSARCQEANTVAGFLKGLEDHFTSINNFLSLASKDNENGNLVTCIRIQTSCFSFGFRRNCFPPGASQVALVVKSLPANAGDIRDEGSIPGLGRPPEEGNGNPSPHSSTLAWRVQWTEEPGGLPSTGSQRVRYDRSNLAYTYTSFARVLEWVAISFSKGSSRPENVPRSPALQADSLLTELRGKPFSYIRHHAVK